MPPAFVLSQDQTLKFTSPETSRLCRSARENLTKGSFTFQRFSPDGSRTRPQSDQIQSPSSSKMRRQRPLASPRPECLRLQAQTSQTAARASLPSSSIHNVQQQSCPTTSPSPDPATNNRHNRHPEPPSATPPPVRYPAKRPGLYARPKELVKPFWKAFPPIAQLFGKGYKNPSDSMDLAPQLWLTNPPAARHSQLGSDRGR